MSRREFLRTATGAVGLAALGASGCRWLLSGDGARAMDAEPGLLVNDVHSRLNLTRVRRIVRPESIAALQGAIREAGRSRLAVSVAGGRHAMGGQQFGTSGLLIDMTGFSRVLEFDRGSGQIELEAGIQWPALMAEMARAQRGSERPWGIIQKQTGTNDLSVGGALAANAHSRGLRLAPIIGDVEAFSLVDADGRLLRCSRQEHPELFRLAIGGYGLFGIIAAVRLRLAPRRPMERIVELLDADGLITAFGRKVDEGFLYGDFQYAIDPDSDDFLRRGILSCYRPVDSAAGADDPGRRELSGEEWRRLILLAHTAPSEAFARYADHYLGTSGQRYWSDAHQLSTYLPDYHAWLDRELGEPDPATEMITEIYVPRQELAGFLAAAREALRQSGVRVIYGTIRLIEQDDESFLAWARQPYACVIFNLHTVHTQDGLRRSADAFRRLIDLAIAREGSYYLTYHRFATDAQLLACYPRFPEFLRLKRRYDPEARFQSDWSRHYASLER